jgi:hypothetical protein
MVVQEFEGRSEYKTTAAIPKEKVEKVPETVKGCSNVKVRR